MSVTMYENSVKRKKDEIARLKKERVRYVNTVSDCSKKILNATKQASSTKSSSTYKSKINEIAIENKKITEYDKKITNKENELLREEQKLNKAKEMEYQKLEKQRKLTNQN